MSTTRKVLTIIFSILIVAAFAFVLTWGIINWSKVKEGMAGNGLYTQDDVQNAYEDVQYRSYRQGRIRQSHQQLPRYDNYTERFNLAVHKRNQRPE